jgi:hypothetical protein
LNLEVVMPSMVVNSESQLKYKISYCNINIGIKVVAQVFCSA